MTYTVGKTNGRWVQVIKFARRVEFSEEQGWFFVCTDWEKPLHKREGWCWIPAHTRFEMVREFVGDGVSDGQ